MDRLSENHRVVPTNRAEAIDFTRSQSKRVERQDEVEAAAERRVNEAPEPFARHLEDQKAAQDQQPTGEDSTETRPTPERAEPVENASIEPLEQPGEVNIVIQGPLPEAASTPQIEGAALEVPPTSPLTPALLAPVLSVVAAATQPGSTVQPAIAQPSQLLGETVESTAAKLGASPADAGTNQIQSLSPKPETPAPKLEIEAPREPQATRSANEVERAADILRQIRVQLTPAIGEARIQLHPADLGRVSIHLRVEEGRMKTVVRAEKTETLQAIQTHLPELRAALRQHGIDAQEFQLLLGFENRPRRDTHDGPSSPHTPTSAAEAPAIERLTALHAAVTKSGVDLYA